MRHNWQEWVTVISVRFQCSFKKSLRFITSSEDSGRYLEQMTMVTTHLTLLFYNT